MQTGGLRRLAKTHEKREKRNFIDTAPTLKDFVMGMIHKYLPWAGKKRVKVMRHLAQRLKSRYKHGRNGKDTLIKLVTHVLGQRVSQQ
jgi:hypothetical protein